MNFLKIEISIKITESKTRFENGQIFGNDFRFIKSIVVSDSCAKNRLGWKHVFTSKETASFDRR